MPVKPILDRFRELYPSSGQPRVFRAPGRVNLIGEHTDYNQGLVLPMAIDLDCLVATAPSTDGWLRVYSDNLTQGTQWRIDDLGRLMPIGDWSDRVAGIVWALGRRGVEIEPRNVLISSRVPLGGGLSSSAALGVSLALAFGGDRAELAQIAHAAETDFVGIPCGIMDQFVSVHGQEGAAILLDCRSLESRTVPMPQGLAIVVVNSMVKHELANSAYRTRVAECAAAARMLGISSLRDEHRLKSVPQPVAQASACESELSKLPDHIFRRARHVLSENLRVEAFAEAAAAGDLEVMGRIATESHASLRDDYEVSCPELDFLVETAVGLPGVLGARMTGGGFGGSTVNFVRPDAVENFNRAVTASYEKHWGKTAEIHVCKASAGASELFL